MKKAGLQIKKDNDKLILIIIFVIVIVFIFGLKQLYKTIEKIKDGTLFKTEETVPEPLPQEEDYKILKPVGENEVLCNKTISTEGGDESIKTTIYYTSKKAKSLKEDISYSGITESYSNFILSELSNYKKRKNYNLDNIGYSIDIELSGTSSLKVSSVYLLSKTNITDIQISDKDRIEAYGTYDEDIYELVKSYSDSGYTCNWWLYGK